MRMADDYRNREERDGRPVEACRVRSESHPNAKSARKLNRLERRAYSTATATATTVTGASRPRMADDYRNREERDGRPVEACRVRSESSTLARVKGQYRSKLLAVRVPFSSLVSRARDNFPCDRGRPGCLLGCKICHGIVVAGAGADENGGRLSEQGRKGWPASRGSSLVSRARDNFPCDRGRPGCLLGVGNRPTTTKRRKVCCGSKQLQDLSWYRGCRSWG
jgi:hypothetical protein